jgi:hypothetical protein
MSPSPPTFQFFQALAPSVRSTILLQTSTSHCVLSMHTRRHKTLQPTNLTSVSASSRPHLTSLLKRNYAARKRRTSRRPCVDLRVTLNRLAAVPPFKTSATPSHGPLLRQFLLPIYACVLCHPALTLPPPSYPSRTRRSVPRPQSKSQGSSVTTGSSHRLHFILLLPRGDLQRTQSLHGGFSLCIYVT